MPVSCEIEIANRNITFLSTVETEKVHFFWQAKKWLDLVSEVLLCLGPKEIWGSCLEMKEGARGLIRKCPPRFTGELLSFLNVAHFSFSLFLWVRWGCAGEVPVLERCRNFNMMSTLTFQGFLVGREDSWRWQPVMTGLLEPELGLKGRSRGIAGLSLLKTLFIFLSLGNSRAFSNVTFTWKISSIHLIHSPGTRLLVPALSYHYSLTMYWFYLFKCLPPFLDYRLSEGSNSIYLVRYCISRPRMVVGLLEVDGSISVKRMNDWIKGTCRNSLGEMHWQNRKIRIRVGNVGWNSIGWNIYGNQRNYSTHIMWIFITAVLNSDQGLGVGEENLRWIFYLQIFSSNCKYFVVWKEMRRYFFHTGML